MREIKFRAFTIEGVMISVGELECMDQHYLVNGEVPILEGRLMQYTGLKDKNGRDVYEGDIIRYITSRATEYAVVEFSEYPDNESYVVFQHMGWNCSGITLPDVISQFGTIVGNIFENPDLIPK